MLTSEWATTLTAFLFHRNSDNFLTDVFVSTIFFEPQIFAITVQICSLY